MKTIIKKKVTLYLESPIYKTLSYEDCIDPRHPFNECYKV